MVTITISGAEKSGALARIAAFLVRKGYPLKGQKIAESASGAKLVKISLEVSHLDKAKLAAEMRSLNPDFKVVSVEGAQTAAPSIKDMADRFPDIASLVRAYGESFGSESRDRELLEAGKKIGAFQYEKEWSFGSPLKMPVALRRTLVPALETLGKVDASDTDVSLPVARNGRSDKETSVSLASTWPRVSRAGTSVRRKATGISSERPKDRRL